MQGTALSAKQLQHANYLRDPVDFQRVYLKRRLWDKQKEILRSIDVNRSTSVKGCHASGKTYTASGIVPWWLQRYDPCLVINTAPTLRQVKVFWNEVSLALGQSSIKLPEPTTTGLVLTKERYAIGLSSGKGVNIQSFHSQNLLVIADEAPGIEEDIWDSLQGIMAGGNVRLLKLGNPTVPSGEFFDDFGKNRAACNGITISAFDSPNLAGVTLEALMGMNEDELAVSPWPFLTTRQWVRDFIRKWGVNHPKVRARVFGEFPPQADNACFPLSWIERAAVEVEAEDIERLFGDGVLHIGIDVAGPGEDETVLAARVGAAVLKIQGWRMDDPRGELARTIYELSHSRRFTDLAVMIDAVGIGAHVATHLADLFPGKVFGFVAGRRARDVENFANAKSEAYWGFRQRLEAKAVRNIQDDDTVAQLSTILYDSRPNGQIEIRSKDERPSTEPSPDRAEALIMAFMPIVQRQVVIEDEGLEEISSV